MAPVLPLIFTLVLAWAVADGDAIWLPVLVLFGSFSAQADLEFVGVVAVVGSWSLFHLLLGRWRARRSAGASSPQPTLRHQKEKAREPSLPIVMGASLLLGLACWSGPLFEAAQHDGGNLREILRALLSPAPQLGPTGAIRALGAVLNLPPYFLRLSTSTQWDRGLDATALISLLCIAWLWWRARQAGPSAVRTLLITAAVAVLACAANGYLLPVEPFQSGHTMFARSVGGFVWFAMAAGVLEFGLPTHWVGWRELVVAAAALLALVGLSELEVAGPLAVGLLLLPAVVLVLALAALAGRLVKVVNRSRSRTVSSATPRWTPRSPALGVGVTVLAAVLVAIPPKLDLDPRGWLYEATPSLEMQLTGRLPVRHTRPNAYLLASGGGEQYLEVTKALIAQFRARHVPVLTTRYRDQTYGARRSYDANRGNAAGEVIVVPDYATVLPPGSRRVAAWSPAGWDQPAVDRLRGDIAAFVRRTGHLELTSDGEKRLEEILAYTVPAKDGSGWPDAAPYLASPERLLSIPPGPLMALYQSDWVTSPDLRADLGKRLDRLTHGPSVSAWFLRAPLPPGTGSRG